MKSLGTALMALLVFSGCSTQPSLPTMADMLQEATGQNGRACVRTNDIRGWGSLEHGVISIDGFNRYYLATLMPGCHEVETSFAALFSGDFGEVCGGSIDRIQVREGGCTVRQMFEFKNREDAFTTYSTLDARRKALREEQKNSN